MWFQRIVALLPVQSSIPVYNSKGPWNTFLSNHVINSPEKHITSQIERCKNFKYPSSTNGVTKICHTFSLLSSLQKCWKLSREWCEGQTKNVTCASWSWAFLQFFSLRMRSFFTAIAGARMDKWQPFAATYVITERAIFKSANGWWAYWAYFPWFVERRESYF